jgi:hypothetical protein
LGVVPSDLDHRAFPETVVAWTKPFQSAQKTTPLDTTGCADMEALAEARQLWWS